MSRWGKISWLLCGLSLVILVAVRFIIGGWLSFLFIPLAIFVLSFFAALIVDFKFYAEFLTMRTTKHGLNMGTIILIVVAILFSLNYLSVQFDKTWDVTEERLNSLSKQSLDVVRPLKEDVRFKVFYRGAKDKDIRERMKGVFDLYLEASSKVKVEFIDAYVNNVMAEKYLKGLGDNEQVVIFAEYGNKKIRVEQPFDEQKITEALIRVTRAGEKAIYFLTGHGEADLGADSDWGLAHFKKALMDSGFKVEPLSLLEKGEIPKDADVLAIVGPRSQIFPEEMDKIREFARRGGRVFIAADPGEKHQIALLTKSFGIEFKNNYIINDAIQLMGRGPAGALGMVFDTGSDITKSFRTRQDFTLFDVASQVERASDAPSGLRFVDLVKTPPNSFVVNDLQQIKPGQRSMITLAVSVSGRLPSAGGDKKDDDKKVTDTNTEFAAVVFGDSDFLTQKDIIQGLNLDLAMNAMASLLKETDLISIRPKQPAGTKMTLSSTTWIMTVIVAILVPLVFFVMSGVMLYRRRNA